MEVPVFIGERGEKILDRVRFACVAQGANFRPMADDLRGKGNPAGRSFTFTMPSSASKIFTGLDTTLIAPKAFTRTVTVYVPAQYKAGTPAPVMVIQDGGGTPFVLIKTALQHNAAAPLKLAVRIRQDAPPWTPAPRLFACESNGFATR